MLDEINPLTGLLLVASFGVSIVSLTAAFISSRMDMWVVALAVSLLVSIVLSAFPILFLSFAIGAGSMFVVRAAGQWLNRIADDQTWLCYYRERNVCWHCQYSLVGLTSSNCPECGADIDTAAAEAEDLAHR